MNVGLSSSILSWFPRDEGGAFLDLSMRQRSYEHLQRAEYFLTYNSNPSDHDRADCISNLRKCLSHRQKHFEEVYNLRSALQTPKKRHYLEILADLGVIRPSLIQGLLQIRNDIEYNDSAPPDISKCRDFSDIVWYFLRSTDPLLYTERTDIILTPPEADTFNSVYWCSLDIQYVPTFEVKLSGWFPPHLVTESPSSADLAIVADKFVTKTDDPVIELAHSSRNADDFWVIGKLVAKAEECRALIRLALTAI